MPTSPRPRKARAANPGKLDYDGRVVLVFEGGGALGAFQVGVYQALHEAGIEPDWVIGTSIGAINAGIIAGSSREERMARLDAFWREVQLPSLPLPDGFPGLQHAQSFSVLTQGVEGFFRPNPATLWNNRAPVGTYEAGYYSTAPLAETLGGLIDVDRLNDPSTTRLTLGAVQVRQGQMHYFDSLRDKLDIANVMASGALPPAFPAVEVDGQPYWDGGVYSNTPVEAVMNDQPRRNSLIFIAHLWHAAGPAPQSVWDAMGRLKDIQYASRIDSYVEEEKKLHSLRNMIHQLGHALPAAKRDDPALREILASGCSTVMHLCRLYAPHLHGEDLSKDIDFSAHGIRLRREAGYRQMRAMLRARPWTQPCKRHEGIVIHGSPGEAAAQEKAQAR